MKINGLMEETGEQREESKGVKGWGTPLGKKGEEDGDELAGQRWGCGRAEPEASREATRHPGSHKGPALGVVKRWTRRVQAASTVGRVPKSDGQGHESAEAGAVQGTPVWYLQSLQKALAREQ